MFGLDGDIPLASYDVEQKVRFPPGDYRLRRSIRPGPLWREHYDGILAEAEANYLLHNLPPGETLLSGLCRVIGRYLVALGRILESYGQQGTARATPEQSSG